MGKAELQRLTDRTAVIRGPVNIGLICDPGSPAILVDSGNDDAAGKAILGICADLKSEVSLILNTHSHADHCGGNHAIQARTSCGIAATKAEAAFIEIPALEPILLWGGSPMPAMRNKFLEARPSSVTMILEPPCPVPGTELLAIPLKGHSLSMIGFLTPDRVCFAADTVASAEILEKYQVFYLHDVGEQLSSLKALMAVEADWFVPSHAPPVEDIAPLVSRNLAKIEEIAAFVVDSCAGTKGLEDLLSAMVARYGLNLNTTQYLLLGATLRAYVSWLVGKGELKPRFAEGRMLFGRD
jgi:glyoxylase-like metal-dependent hydrolase (beta-lactamase superfamily II)